MGLSPLVGDCRIRQNNPAKEPAMNSIYVTLYIFGLDLTDRFRNEDRGATAVEYGLLVGLIAVVIIVGVSALGTNLTGLFNKSASSV